MSDEKKKTTSPKTKDDDGNSSGSERDLTIEEIDKELDELRPVPPSPRTQRRIEQEEEKKDQEKQAHQQDKTDAPVAILSSDNEHQTQHNEHELTPGKPDPSVNDNLKIPIMDERGAVELKPQQGSKLNKH